MRARKKGVTPTRMLAILKRQATPRWGSDYEPSILATPQEAPSISHACTLNSSKLGREVLARHDLLPGCGNPQLLKFRTQVCGRRDRSACLHDSALPCTPQGVRGGAVTENT